MEITWRETDSGQIVLEHQLPLPRRIALGALPALIAAYFLYHLVSALLLYVRSASGREWLSALPGLLIGLALLLVFGVPAWMLLLGRKRIVVDPARGSLDVVHDAYFLQWSWSYPIDRVRDVRVGTRVSGSYRRRARTWEIQIDLEGRTRPIVVGRERVTRDADELAKRLAGRLGLT